MIRRVLLLAAVFAAACAGGPPVPAPLDTKNDACANCRMAVSDARFAAQIVAPGELPRFFDDIGCLAAQLRAGQLPAGAVAYVADHRTKAWTRADAAVFTRVAALETPMGSHIIAHVDAASRAADPAAAAGEFLTLDGLVGGRP